MCDLCTRGFTGEACANLMEAMFVFSESVTNVLESITDSFLVVDANWRVIYMNAASRRIFAAQGLKPDELLEKHFWEEAFPKHVAQLSNENTGAR